ncbi:MAG: phage distal tail protein, partial [Christensenellales bacterium]
PKDRLARFQFSLLAPYPYWCRDDSASATLSGVQKLFKLPCNFSKTYRFGELMQTQFMNVANHGQVPIPYTATFVAKGDVVNPKITNATTGKFLLIKKTLVSGERLVVEITHERTYVTSSVDGDCRGALSLTSNLFRLDVGDNVLKPEAASGLDNLQVDVDFATEIVGIAL